MFRKVRLWGVVEDEVGAVGDVDAAVAVGRGAAVPGGSAGGGGGAGVVEAAADGGGSGAADSAKEKIELIKELCFPN